MKRKENAKEDEKKMQFGKLKRKQNNETKNKRQLSTQNINHMKRV